MSTIIRTTKSTQQTPPPPNVGQITGADKQGAPPQDTLNVDIDTAIQAGVDGQAGPEIEQPENKPNTVLFLVVVGAFILWLRSR